MTKKSKLSVVLATLNEEANIGKCLESVRDIADEILIFDEESIDKTVDIAKKHGAKVTFYVHKANFHETKQKAIEKATGDWILQLDADERVSPELAKEISEVVNATNKQLMERVLSHPERAKIRSLATGRQASSTDESEFFRLPHNDKKLKLFERHEHLIKEREGKLGNQTGEVTAFFIPRLNYFVGKPLRHAGVYPDAVIRLIKRGKARLPAKSVHELMEVDGEVGWLFSDLEHHESPTLNRYIARANRYTDLTANELKEKGVAKSNWQLFYYTIIKTKLTFFKLYIRHKGYKDGIRGFLWSFFSAMHQALAYWKYYVS